MGEQEDEEEKVDPLLEAAGLCSKFTLLRQSKQVNDKKEEDKILKELMQIYDGNNMIEFYRNLCTQNNLSLDESLISKWTANKADLLKKNEEKKALQKRMRAMLKFMKQRLNEHTFYRLLLI